ncbi:UDP-N-acetylglucosamine 2-epimerase [Desulfofundulus kuznetsovii DSM 6115]|uniref:UDP-N-acetylglucosamine 2-epimerase n=1 Tax=Desulfofundulus kuznetsovii (strain DSM 6115 / VKM B-1805 / 17) TaxID=760568 RepID=A0AAU8P8F0_DESK7|nr:UDP-N-acetylglucosamine 2-epimerase [Desulfofundulus kuznetsovii DSM 6115]
MKVVTVIGVRPQFIKAAAVSQQFRKAGVREVLVHTGQHYDYSMNKVFFEQLGLPKPDYVLPKDGFSCTGWSRICAAAEAVAGILARECPDWVLVYGDANPALSGALAAVRTGIPLAHVEAGLRSGDFRMIEEGNRKVIDRLADILFAPTETAVKNLNSEGLFRGVYLVGDVMYNVLMENLPRAADSNILQKLDLVQGKYALATVHRAENVNNPAVLRRILDGLERVAAHLLPVVVPAHPGLSHKLTIFGLVTNRVRMIDPQPYLDMLWLVKNAALVLTDSGGLQKEACWLQTPCVVLRNSTEWVETVTSGWADLAGNDPENIFQTARQQLDNRSRRLISWQSSAGAAARIVDILLSR